MFPWFRIEKIHSFYNHHVWRIEKDSSSQSRIKGWNQSRRRSEETAKTYKYWIIEFRLQHNFCKGILIRIKPSDWDNPYVCRGDISIHDFETRLTFVESGIQYLAARIGFSESPHFWASPTIFLSNTPFSTKSLFRVQRYYVAKKVLPFVSYWVQAGLDVYGLAVIANQKLRERYFRGERAIDFETSSVSDLKIQFTPMQITSLTPILKILVVFIGLVIGTILSEVATRNQMNVADSFYRIIRCIATARWVRFFKIEKRPRHPPPQASTTTNTPTPTESLSDSD